MTRPLHSRLASLPAIELPDPFAVLEHPRYWFALALQGDAPAALGVYGVLRNARTFGPPIADLDPRNIPEFNGLINNNWNCPSIPANFADDELRWLEPAAQAGDVNVRLQYAMVANLVFVNTGRPRPDAERGEQIRSNAMRWLDELRREGIGEAFLVLVGAHSTGFITAVDPVRALAYLEALATLSAEPSIAGHIAERRRGMSDADTVAAMALAERFVNECRTVRPAARSAGSTD